MKITASEMLVSTDDYMRLRDECEALRNQIAVLIGQVSALTTERDELYKVAGDMAESIVVADLRGARTALAKFRALDAARKEKV